MERDTYTYSQLSSDTVRNLVEMHYELPPLTHCRFYVLGLHDNYLIEANQKKYILRLYRNNWRSREDVLFELELLAFLGERTELVAFPIRTNKDGLSFSIDCPEGQREAALFPYARGQAPGDEISIKDSHLLGNAVAQIHSLTDDFIPSYERCILDIPYLLDDSVAAIASFLDSSSRVYIKTLQKRLHKAIPPLSQEQALFGICIGDVNATNFHIDEHRRLTLFDFDQCGYGYRSFEIGKYLSSLPSGIKRQALTDAFLDGYEQIRELSQTEHSSIPYFEIISLIWVMAIHVYNVDRTGYKWLEGPFWNRRLAILRALDKNTPWS